MHLPEFWQFLRAGWWVLHIFAIGIIYLGGIAHGRKIGRREAERKSGSAADRGRTC